MRNISDYLFMGSLILLIITFLVKGVVSRGDMYHGNPDGANVATDLQMKHDHKKVIERQDGLIFRVIKSYIFWISILGMISSIILSHLSE